MIDIIREDKLVCENGTSSKIYKLTMLKHKDNTLRVYGLCGKRW